jgi:signal transduction histidine kinase/ligand-binding sensor domain-containing protein/DNA-binding response OmpR family regulator
MSSFKTSFCLVLFACLIFFQQAAAIEGEPINRLGIQHGLSNNSVRCIYQDHKGLMWFGTYDGLNMYDGYNFTVFRNKLNDSSSLPHNYIYSIHEDRKNNLWIGTGQGIAIYNSIYSRFKPAYFYSHLAKEKQRIRFNVTAVRSDVDNTVFIASNGWGLLVKKDKDEVSFQIPLTRNKQEQTTNYNVQTLTIDKQDRVWLFVLNYGLCLFDKKKNSIQLVNSEVKSANALQPDDEGNIWIGSNTGLYKYSISSNSIIDRHNEQTGSLIINDIACLFLDNNKNLWVGTEGGGVNILHHSTGKFQYILPGVGDQSLSSESVFSIMSDNESRMWMGTLKGGLNVIDPQKGRFQTISHKINDRNSLVNNFVSSFYETSAGELMIGSDGGGLSIWNRQQKTFTNFSHDASNSSSLSSNSISSVTQDHLGDTWITTFGGGVNKFDKARGSFEHYKCVNDATGEENKKVWLVYEDLDKNLWVSTFGNGKLYRFNRQLKRFQVFDQQLNDLIALREDHNGVMWGGNSHQLVRIEKKSNNHTFYEIGKPVRSIYEDKANNLWVGTEGGGLILFDGTNGKIVQRYSDADGLSNNSVLNILADNEGNLWLSTFNGLSKFDAVRKTFKNFYQSDGVQSNQFNYNAALRLRSGELAFGGINGFNIFDPIKITTRTFMPPVLFTGIWINNKPVTEAEKFIIYNDKDDRVLALEVPFNEAVLSFDFTALEYSSPDKIKYAYFLENMDNGWNYTDNIRAINYNNIKEGRYTLRVKSTNAEGTWNTEEAIIKIRILPPWFRSWWAYLLYTLVTVSIAWVVIRYRINQSRLKYEIKVAYINAEKEKEINEKRQSFFTNISHEFRTPLTLIINPARDLLAKESPEDNGERKELTIIHRNARRLLSLVDQLLLFRKAENNADQLRVGKLDFHELCREVYLCFTQQAKSKHIEYIFETPGESLELYADRDKLEIVFYNLLSNALKYTPDGGKVVFSIVETAETMEVRVDDTGCGIPKTVGTKLFEKFYQVRDKQSASKPGFGIGLYLAKYFVDIHHGFIRYESEGRQGTSFCVTLQKGKTHFAETELFEETKAGTGIFKELSGIEADQQQDTIIEGGKAGLEAVITDDQSILVIDDNDQMRDYVAEIFKEHFTIYKASKAEDGLTLAKKYSPDIIISDINMEEMSGIELCRIIKQTSSLSHIPVILLTGALSPESKLKGVEGGADDYITKPFEKDLLVARVTNLLKSRQVQQQYFYNEITHQENNLKISKAYKEFLEKCISIVEAHLGNDEFTIQTLATEIGMSHSSLYKKIKAISGQSANSFIRFIRLRKAAELFINTNYNVNETAFYVGIKDVKYFREQFSKTFGMKPSEYIEKYRKVFSKHFSLSEKAVRNKNKKRQDI